MSHSGLYTENFPYPKTSCYVSPHLTSLPFEVQKSIADKRQLKLKACLMKCGSGGNLSVMYNRCSYSEQTTRLGFLQSNCFLIGLFFILLIFRGFLLIHSIPLWQGADEIFHFESIRLHGQQFPILPSTFDPKLQKQILHSMVKNNFWLYLKLPEPMDPNSFASEPFLRDAPSKLGRPPLYYWVMGLLVSQWSLQLESQVILTREINLVLMIFSGLLIASTCRTSGKHNSFSLLTALSIIFMNPALSFQSCTANMTAWMIFINSIGLWLANRMYSSRLTAVNVSLFFIYLLVCSLTQLQLLMAGMALALVISYGHFKKNTPLRKSSLLIGGLIMLGITLISLFSLLRISMSGQLFHHEITQLLSGLAHLKAATFPDLFGLIGSLHSTFWTGFGWLTVPSLPISMLIFSFISLALLVISLFSFAKVNQFDRSLLLFFWILVFFYFGSAVIRGLADDKAIQGRYLYPSMPYLAAILYSGSVRLMRLVKNSKPVFVILLGIIAFADFGTTFTGWFDYYHTATPGRSRFVELVSNLEIPRDTSFECSIDLGKGPSDLFLGQGWYPSEPGHAWFRSTGCVWLPLIPENWLNAEIKVYPYQPSVEYQQSLVCYFNDHVFYEDKISPDWSIVNGRIDPAWIGRINLLKLEGSAASSPADHGNPADTRILSIACDWVRLTSLEKPPPVVTWKVDTSGFGMDLGNRMGNHSQIRFDTRHPVWEVEKFSALNDISASLLEGILFENLKKHIPLTLLWIFGILIFIAGMLYEPAAK